MGSVIVAIAVVGAITGAGRVAADLVDEAEFTTFRNGIRFIEPVFDRTGFLAAQNSARLAVAFPIGSGLLGAGGANVGFVELGGSPALIVEPSEGQVQVQNVSLSTSTDSPTIQVLGGSLTLANDIIREGAEATVARLRLAAPSPVLCGGRRPCPDDLI